MSKRSLIRFVESLFPQQLIAAYRKTKRFLLWKIQQVTYRRVEKNIKKKEGPLNVVFIVQNQSIWKLESLYRMMEKDSDFIPTVFICPNTSRGEDFSHETLIKTCEYFKSDNYHVVCAYDNHSGTLLDIKELNPDIVFYTYPYGTNIPSQYFVFKLRRCLKCYVNYAFVSVPYEWAIASTFHGLMWKYFVECEENLKLAQSYQPREMANAIVSGYPVFDEFLQCKEVGRDWKKSDRKYKRIIWAPHHTIEGQTGMLQFSTFLLYYNYMLELAEKYKDTIQFAFKPHPMLKPALYSHPQWGKEKTDAYYQRWMEGDNTSYVSGNYTDLFLSSDAMIHDCGSFIIEYLYTRKPVMFLSNFDREGQSNEVGRKAYQCHYKGYCEGDIEHFVNSVVINSQDDLIEQRHNFYDTILSPVNGKTSAENILKIIKTELRK